MYYLAGQFRRLEIPYFEICLYFENLSQKYNLVVYLHWMDISFDKYCIKVSLFRNVFLVSPILPKNEHENSNFCPSLLGQKFFVHFLGELKKPKCLFEINWPLAKVCCTCWSDYEDGFFENRKMPKEMQTAWQETRYIIMTLLSSASVLQFFLFFLMSKVVAQP